MNEHTAEPMWGLQKVAELLGISTRTVWRRVDDGEIPKPVKVGSLDRWFQSDITNYQQRLRKQRGE